MGVEIVEVGRVRLWMLVGDRDEMVGEVAEGDAIEMVTEEGLLRLEENDGEMVGEVEEGDDIK